MLLFFRNFGLRPVIGAVIAFVAIQTASATEFRSLQDSDGLVSYVTSISRADSQKAIALAGQSSCSECQSPCAGKLESCSTCPTSCCLPCNPCPCVYGFSEGLLLQRNNQAANRPLVFDLNTNDVLLSAGDLDFQAEVGVRSLLGVRVTDRHAVELGYLGVFDMSSQRSVTREDLLTLPPPLGLAVNNFFAADRVVVGYGSDLRSGEINLAGCACTCASRANCKSVEWLLGFRYLGLDEHMAITSIDSAESTSVYGVNVRNQLYGGQIGGRWRGGRNRLSWEFVGKAGLFGNDIRQSQPPIVDFPNFEFRSARSSSGSDTAFVGELNLTGIYRINSTLGIRAGYNLMWIEGVALAPNQLDFTDTPVSGTGLVAGSGVFLHGASFGLEGRW